MLSLNKGVKFEFLRVTNYKKAFSFFIKKMSGKYYYELFDTHFRLKTRSGLQMIVILEESDLVFEVISVINHRQCL